MVIDKKVQMSLVGVDGNAFVIMGTFREEARKQGWTKEEIAAVIGEAMTVDYNHLLSTIMEHCEELN